MSVITSYSIHYTKLYEGWFYVWVPDWANHVIINANAGSVQTSELILNGTNAWVTITDAENVITSYSIHYTKLYESSA